MYVKRVNTERMFLEIKDDYFYHLEKALSVSETSNGIYCKKVEEMLVDFYGVKFAKLTVNATSALIQMALIHKLKAGDEVIVTPYTCSHAIMPFKVVGASLVFCDINKYGVIDVDKIESLISNKTKAIAATGMFGNPVDFDKIKSLAQKYNLKIISDISQSQNTDYKGAPVAHQTEFCAISFGRQKEIPVFGTYGAVLGINADLDPCVNSARLCGMGYKNLLGRAKVSSIGINGEPHEDKAVAVYISMLNAEKWLKRRKQVANYYEEQLSYQNITTLPTPVYTSSSSYQKFIVLVKNKYLVFDEMKKRGIEVQDHYPENLAQNPIISSQTKDSFSNTDFLLYNSISLPIDAWLTDEEISYVINNLIDIVDQNELRL